MLADIVGDVLDEECGEVHGLVGGAADAEGPFEVILVELCEALALGKEGTIGDAWAKGVVLSA